MEANTKVLSNGAVYDLDKKRIVSGAVLTSDTAREMVKARIEKHQQLSNEGALLAVDRADMREKYGADAHIVERAYNMQKMATTLDAGKAAVMAAQHLDKAQGYDVKQIADEQPAHTTNNIVLLMIQEAHKRGIAFDNSNYRNHEVVDGETNEA